MVTQEQLIKGIITYTDKEVMPHLPTVGRWGVGSVIILAQGRISQIADSMLSNTFAKTLLSLAYMR